MNNNRYVANVEICGFIVGKEEKTKYVAYFSIFLLNLSGACFKLVVEDGTGTMTSILWFDAETRELQVRNTLDIGIYVRVFGRLQNWIDERCLIISSLGKELTTLHPCSNRFFVAKSKNLMTISRLFVG